MVSLYSQILQKKYGAKLDGDADQLIAFVVGGAKRMEMLLKDLLTYSRAGSSDEGPPRPIDCERVVRKVLLNLEASIQQEAAAITWDPLPTVEAHEIRLVQLFQNLISNAIKYRSTAPPEIRLWAEPSEAGWIISVRDNGIGIEPEYAQQVFGIFKRLHGQKYPGTGIGLAICQRIVERYGGRIWVDSQAGAGSVFRFTLPAIKDEQQSGFTPDMAYRAMGD